MAIQTLRIVLGDQLSRDLSALEGLATGDAVLMMEVAGEATYVRHHKQKIIFVLSAMRHFAGDLRAEGIRVDYVALDDAENTGTLTQEVERAVSRLKPKQIVATEPGEWRVLQEMRTWEKRTGIPVELRDDTRFFATRADFRRWAEGRRSLRMEFFYRDMRRRTGLLMNDDEPIGGAWNFDSENRKSIPKTLAVPQRQPPVVDAITHDVTALVTAHFGDHFGDVGPLHFPVTRVGALAALDDFIVHGLPSFGDYQDAMKQGEPFLFHSLLSPCINVGLLSPREVCARAEAAYHAGDAPLNAVEGFIRQILGWREYVRGIYWLKMPDYAQTNHLNAQRALPRFFWTGQSGMACMDDAIGNTRRHAYAHHIQRLMITGNFALLAGLDPAAVEEWYLIVYADAYEWVELPNVHGMVLFADGGLLGSKPYAASGAYIDRMSDHCRTCRYKVKEKLGPKACPFNYLYWDFLIRNRGKLERNPRMAMPYRTLAKMEPQRIAAITANAAAFLDAMEPSQAGDY